MCCIFLLSFSPLPRYDKGLCFSNCPTGYIGAGKLCWSLTSAQRKIVQGEGTAADACPPEKPSKEGGLCYLRCLRGWTGDGSVCRKEWVRNLFTLKKSVVYFYQSKAEKVRGRGFVDFLFRSSADLFDLWVKKTGFMPFMQRKRENKKKSKVSSASVDSVLDVMSSAKLCGKHSE